MAIFTKFRVSETHRTLYPSIRVPDLENHLPAGTIDFTSRQKRPATRAAFRWARYAEAMFRNPRIATICLTSAILLVCAQLATAQQAADVPPALGRVQILTAKKIFIANGDSDPVLGVPYLAYSEFYASLKNLGIYPFVRTPAAANVVLGVRCAIGLRSQGCYMLRLAIVDPKTSIVL
jgi:hypothetical protein